MLKTLAVLLAAVSLSGAAAAPASASVTPDLSFTGASTSPPTFGGTLITCTGSTIAGTSGSGSVLATLSSMAFSGCTSGLGAVTTTVNCLPVSVTAGTTTSGITSVTAPLCLKFTTPLCTFSLTGSDSGTYTISTAVLAFNGTITVSGVSGCAGLVHNGDHMATSMSYHLTPPLP